MEGQVGVMLQEYHQASRGSRSCCMVQSELIQDLGERQPAVWADRAELGERGMCKLLPHHW